MIEFPQDEIAVVPATERCNCGASGDKRAYLAPAGRNEVFTPRPVASPTDFYESRRLPAGVSTLSNAALDTPWPKTARLQEALDRWAAGGADDLEPVFSALGDRTIAPDAELPSTGVPLDRERLLSAAFIIGEAYGTRCSTILALAGDGSARFVERTFDRAGRAIGEVDERYELAPVLPRR